MIALPNPQAFAVRVLAALAVAAVGFGGGWAVNGWRLGAQVAKVQADHSQAVADATAATLAQLKNATAERDRLADSLARVDVDGLTALRKAENETKHWRDCVRNGSCVVRVRGACSPAGPADVSQTAAGSRVDTGAGTVLAADAGQAVLDLRDGAERFAVKLAACQAALSRITGQ